MSEFTMQSFGGIAISSIRLLLGGKVTKPHKGAILSDACSPFAVSFVPTHALDATLVICIYAFVAGLLGYGSNSQIGASVVECFAAVTVVTLALILAVKAENLTVHPDHVPVPFRNRWTFFSDCIKTLARWAPMSVPLPLIQPVIVSSVHDSELSLSERNQAAGSHRKRR